MTEKICGSVELSGLDSAHIRYVSMELTKAEQTSEAHIFPYKRTEEMLMNMLTCSW